MMDRFLSKVKNLINDIKNDKTKHTIATISLIVVCFFAFNLGDLLGKAFTSLVNIFSNVEGEVKQIIIKTDDFDSDVGGNVKITKSADWIDRNSAQMVYEVETIMEANTLAKDVILVLDTSVSMEGNRLSNMKTEINELFDKLLVDDKNKVGIIAFNDDSEILTELTSDETVLRNLISGLVANGDTNYNQALIDVSTMLEGYQATEGRELVILFATDGYPNIETPNHISQYIILKSKYPYAKIYGIDYDAGGELIDGLKSISDEQFIAYEYDNVFITATMSPEYYEKFEIIEYVDNDYLYIDSTDDVEVSMGSVQLTEENGKQKLIWSVSEKEFVSGNTATMEIKIRLNSSLVGVEGLYPTSTKEAINYKLYNANLNSFESTDTTILKNGYKMTYEANTPAGCNASIDLEEVHYANDTVPFSSVKLECDGYQFKGWEVVGNVTKVNDETILMPTRNIIVRGQWSQLGLNKTMDGTVYEKLTLYKTIARKAVSDNIKSEYVTSGTGINFSEVSSDTNGKGVYTIASTANDEYPIHYYRGAVDNNHVLFAGYCWEIVRTTDTGGVKIIFDGTPTDEGYCTNTGTDTQLDSVEFNAGFNQTLAASGYMYNATAASKYTYNTKSFTSSKNILTTKYGMASTVYYYSATEPTHDGTNYVLASDAATYTWESNYSTLGTGYYTCFSATDTSCSTVYYVVGANSSTAYYLSLSGGQKLADIDDMTFGASVVDNGDGTYTLGDLTTAKKSEWYTKYSSSRNYYTCPDNTSTTCSELGYITSTSNSTYTYISATDNYMYGNSVSYDESTGTYTLTDTISFWDYPNNYTKLKNYHYTCWNSDGNCSTVSYIYDGTNSMALYIKLIDNNRVENALYDLLDFNVTTQLTDSTMKNYLDNTWYKEKMTDYTKYLENSIYCNDRSVYNLGGWNPNGGSMERLAFSISNRLYYYRYAPTLNCDTEDSFTLSKDAGGVDGYGNNALDYPVGLITADEVVYAGGVLVTSSDYYLNTGTSYWTLTPGYFSYWSTNHFYVTNNGGLDSILSMNDFGARPVVSLVPDIEYSAGDGTEESPYVIDLNSVQ